MSGAIRINLHSHSTFSDGLLSPEELAGLLADGGAAVAALTDHDTLEGAARFREALSLRGVAYVDALELTTFCVYGEIHLLAYGIDVDAPELLTALAVVNGRADEELQGFLDQLRHLGKRPHAGRLDTEAAIGLVHRSGGIAVLAHPLNITFVSGDLETLTADLAAAGLDGLEALYGPYDAAERADLTALAARHGLCVSMGTDFHAPDDPAHRAVMEVDERVWRAFRDRLLGQGGAEPAKTEPPTASAAAVPQAEKRRDVPFRLGPYSLRIGLASAVALGLFVLAIFAISIPYFKNTLRERKKELIRELTAEAVSLVDEYAEDERGGIATREEAQRNALAHLRKLRYGREGKDYFWVTDTVPRMLLHPYRADLEGRDVSDFRDDNGLRVFYEFTRAVREEAEGYVEYLWQWKDDADRIVPKLSYVKRYDPWGWIIGTGIYLDDVDAEIDQLTRRMIRLSLIVAAILVFLLGFIARQSFLMEREKGAADFAVRESKERYRALVEAGSEGMVIVIDGLCTFANAAFLKLGGYTETETVLLGISEILLPYPGEEEALVSFLAGLPRNQSDADEDAEAAAAAAAAVVANGSSLACLFRRRSGEPLDVAINASGFSLAGRKGAVLAIKNTATAAERDTQAAAPLLPIGYFSARLNSRGALIDADAQARLLFGLDQAAAVTRFGLSDLFGDAAAWHAFNAELLALGRMERRTIEGGTPGKSLRISAVLESGGAQEARIIRGAVEAPDPSAREAESLRAALLRSEARLAAFDAPIPASAAALPSLTLDRTVQAAAELLSRHNCDALLVRDGDGRSVGIVSDADLRSRVTAEGLGPDTRLGEVMSAPLVAVREGTTWAQAARLMRQKGIRHLVLRDDAGADLALVGRNDLVRLEDDALYLLLAQAAEARGTAELGDVFRSLQDRVRLLAGAGYRPRLVKEQYSAVLDAIVCRLAVLAEAELGPAPLAYAFLLLGSGGRGEALPGSDQDNALVYADPPDAVPADAAAPPGPYFLRLGAWINDALRDLGVPYCPGGVMARNKAWCAPLGVWRKNFARWIAAPEGEDLLSLTIAFDFRAVCGDQDLADRLRGHLAGLLRQNPAFFVHLAGASLRWKSGAGEGEVDVKELTGQLAMYARLYALHAEAGETNTFRRLERLASVDEFGPALAAEVLDLYQALQGVRLASGATGIKLPMKAFRPLDQALLREAYERTSLLRKKIGFDFPGSAL